MPGRDPEWTLGVDGASWRIEPEPRPHVGHYLNFFYALQWWFFAGLAVIAPFWFSRPHPQRDGQAKAMRSA